MTSSDSKDEEQMLPSNPQDLATAYRELTKGEQTATQLEANLTNLESKLDAMLAAFEQHEGSNSKDNDKTSSDGKAGSGSSSSKGV